MFEERLESPGATGDKALYPFPGLTLLATSGASPGRGQFAESGRLWQVVGTTFQEMDQSGNITVRGTVAADANPADITSNGDGGGQLLIVSGGNAYYYTIATATLVQIAVLDGKATRGDYLDGYGLVLDANSSTLYISALLDFSSWTLGTDFAQRSAASDSWVSMRVFGIYIALLGEKTSEFWYDAGGASFPFAKHPSGGPIPHGCVAPFSVTVGEGSLFWLAQSSIGKNYVVRTTGFTPEVVSDFPRQRLFAGYANADDAVAELKNWNGHTFYKITFRAANISWVYDLASSKWLQEGPWISEDNTFAASRTRWPVVVFGEHRCLDSETGAIYRIDADSHEDVDSRPLVCERTAPALVSENELIFYASLELDIQVGVGLVTGQGSEPRVMLQYSNDGGNTWSAELWRSLGKVGEYLTRVRWVALGAARRRVFRVRISDPVAVGIVGAYIELGQQIRSLQRSA
jgi:hypothetical protein